LGFNGRPNYVWDTEKQTIALGRFGWKANQPSLRQQAASAFVNDMGVTTSVFKRENCPKIQIACRKRPTGMVPEQPDRAFNELLFFTRALGVPARRRIDDPVIVHGEQLFAQAQCAVCHVPEIKTGDYSALPLLGNQVIHPYTDLLLHDMGDGLADGRPDFRAGPRDWRTPPLWGIGLSEKVNGNSSLLHDGRARNPTEAILWHGGEAEVSREAFRRMLKTEREALLTFLSSL
ncbi:MAG: di-heme oxidoredictase family protein, partial [Betaproteobacteria bacterium]